MCNISRRLFSNSYDQFNDENSSNNEMNRVVIHHLTMAHEGPSSADALPSVRASRPTPLLTKLIRYRKSKDIRLLESARCSSDQYQVAYIPKGDTVEKVAVRKGNYQTMFSPHYQIYKTTIKALKESEKNDQHRDLNDFMESCIETMSDTPEGRDLIRGLLDDFNYSSINFSHHFDSADVQSPIFYAVFQPNLKIPFSNRSGGVEIRGTILKNILKEQQYFNLKDLLRRLYKTKHDHQAAYMVSGILKTHISAKCQELEFTPEQVNLLKQQIQNETFHGVPLIELLPSYFE